MTSKRSPVTNLKGGQRVELEGLRTADCRRGGSARGGEWSGIMNANDNQPSRIGLAAQL